MSDPDQLVLYGTLREGLPAHHELRLPTMLEHLGPCWIRGALHNLGDYPGLVHGDGMVAADLYRVLDRRLFAILDEYEGFWPDQPEVSWYLRLQIRPIGSEEEAWVYFYNRSVTTDSLIASGDWLQHRRGTDISR